MSPDPDDDHRDRGRSLRARNSEHEGLSVRGLRASGAGGLELGPVSFDVAPGTLTCVVGAAGAGKTLLLSALVGLAPWSTPGGGVRIGRTHLGRDPLSVVRQELGVAFQRDALLDDATALENVLIALSGHPDDEARARAALAAVGLLGAEAKRPSSLSGGMRRRVGLARALVRRPAVLLLDDVTAGLDPSTAAEVLERILALTGEAGEQRAAAVLLATADVDTALPLASEVLLLVEGKVAFQGPPQALSEQRRFAAFAPRRYAAEATAC